MDKRHQPQVFTLACILERPPARKEYAEGRALETLTLNKDQIHVETSLHLSVSMRSFRAEKVSLFVHQLLELHPQQAHDTLTELCNYPIAVTRSLDTAKKWLKQKHAAANATAFWHAAKAKD